MQAQQVFDTAATFLRLQESRCHDGKMCAYRMNGRCCVAGFFIKDAYYSSRLEGHRVDEGEVRVALKQSGFDLTYLTLLGHLQGIHDNSIHDRQEHIRNSLLSLANFENLNPSIVNCIFPGDFENQSEMAAQQVFDTAATFLRLQESRCSTTAGSCRYRHAGRCCVGGFFIKDKYYSEDFEGLPIDRLQIALKQSGFDLQHLDLLKSLQGIHDVGYVTKADRQRGIYTDLIIVAKKRKLDPSIVNCIFP